jgi:hypothetical protein
MPSPLKTQKQIYEGIIMTQIRAIAAFARVITTSYGETKTVLNARLSTGENISIWESGRNERLLSVINGERVLVEVIPRHSHGYDYKLIPRHSTPAIAPMPAQKPLAANLIGLRSAQLLNGLGF